MAGQVSFNALIEALAGAVIEAQDRIEQYQIANISRYFDDDNRPVSVNVRLPSVDPAAKPEDEVLYRVPLLALVSSNLLRIKEVEISFDAELGAFTETGAEAPAPPEPETGGEEAKKARAEAVIKEWRARGPGKAVTVDMRAGMFRKKGGTAHVVLKVEGREPTEGMARLIEHLVKLI